MPAEAVQILVVEDDASFSALLREELEGRGHSVVTAATVAEARNWLQDTGFDVVLLDLHLPDGSGLTLLREIATEGLATESVILTAQPELPSAIEAMKLGAYDYLPKPARLDELHVLVERAAEKARLRRDNAALRVRLQRHEAVRGLITADAATTRMLSSLERVAASDLPVLIQGESGTGKELVARAVHAKSPRSAFPFIPINCAALPEAIIESELFGHERGAFTGAVERKTGLFEVASRGVVFLDEVGELGISLQAKLLRVIESKEFFRVGGTKVVRVDVRIVSATNRDLRAEVESGRFREDLFYRLNGVSVVLPPLRERRGDIPLLARHFLDRVGGGKMVSPAAMEVLQSYHWPGNVRELEMVIQRAALLAAEAVITPEDLPLDIRPRATPRVLRTDLTLEEIEKEYVKAVLERNHGHRGRTAKILGIDPKTLYNKLRSWGEA
jgi:DNA-binding NtrC family response regulator